MNPFLMDSRNRSLSWRKLRENISNENDFDKAKIVSHYWSQAPLENIAYDIEDIENIPTAWEMIDNNHWCRNSIAIGMEFTLRLSGVNESRLQLNMVIDPEISDMMLVCRMDNFILNYEYDRIHLNFSKSARIIKTIKYIKNGYKDLLI